MIHLAVAITDADIADHRTCHVTQCLIGKALNRALGDLGTGYVLAEHFAIDLGGVIVEVPMDRRLRRLVERCDCGDPIQPCTFEIQIPEPPRVPAEVPSPKARSPRRCRSEPSTTTRSTR